jgi:hypothetical protein
MMLRTIIAISASAFLVTSCVTETSYKQAQEVMRGSPAVKRDAIADCYRGAGRASPARKTQMAKIMNVSPRSNVARTYCTRAFNAVADGRISYQDFRTRSPKFIRVIQGRG